MYKFGHTFRTNCINFDVKTIADGKDVCLFPNDKERFKTRRK